MKFLVFNQLVYLPITNAKEILSPEEMELKRNALDLERARLINSMIENPLFPMTPETKTVFAHEVFKNYNRPHIEQVTVGFSGIDPQKKCDCSQDISDELEKKLKELKILIDSGNIDPDPPDPPIEPVQPTILTTDHEELDNLLGGNEDGHYHLTDAELQKLQNMPAQGMQGVDGKSATIRIGTQGKT